MYSGISAKPLSVSSTTVQCGSQWCQNTFSQFHDYSMRKPMVSEYFLSVPRLFNAEANGVRRPYIVLARGYPSLPFIRLSVLAVRVISSSKPCSCRLLLTSGPNREYLTGRGQFLTRMVLSDEDPSKVISTGPCEGPLKGDDEGSVR